MFVCVSISVFCYIRVSWPFDTYHVISSKVRYLTTLFMQESVRLSMDMVDLGVACIQSGLANVHANTPDLYIC